MRAQLAPQQTFHQALRRAFVASSFVTNSSQAAQHHLLHHHGHAALIILHNTQNYLVMPM